MCAAQRKVTGDDADHDRKTTMNTATKPMVPATTALKVRTALKSGTDGATRTDAQRRFLPPW